MKKNIQLLLLLAGGAVAHLDGDEATLIGEAAAVEKHLGQLSDQSRVPVIREAPVVEGRRGGSALTFSAFGCYCYSQSFRDRANQPRYEQDPEFYHQH